jgi:hypothetical protein
MPLTATFSGVSPDAPAPGFGWNRPATFTLSGTWTASGPNPKSLVIYIRPAPLPGSPPPPEPPWTTYVAVQNISGGPASGSWNIAVDLGFGEYQVGYRWFPRADPLSEPLPAGPNDNVFTETILVDANVPCFLPGTRIATPSGEVAVETLQPGDLVLTADGRAVPVRFLGRRTVMPRFAGAERANPIRIMAGALAENVPARDLFVSPNHGIVVDGVLAIASALTNGTTIAQVPPPAERFTYYSIETEGHEVILAEGCPAETFMDHVPRARWDNYQDYLALHPDEPQIAEMDLPHAKSHRQVPREIHARIAERAAALLGPVRDAA